MTPLTSFDQLAHTIATGGFDTIPATVIDDLADQAVAIGASPVVASVLTDPSAPEVVRIRAFGRLAIVAGRPARASFAFAA